MKKKIFIITGAVVLLFSFYLLSCHKEWANPAYDKEGNPVGSNINIPGEVIWNTNSAFLPQVPSGTDLLYDAHVYYDTDTGTVSIVMEPYEQLHQLYIVVDYLGSYTTNTMVLDNNNNYVYQDGGFDYGDMIDFFFVAEKDNDLWCGDLPPAYPHSVVLGSSASSFSSSNFSSSFFTSSSGFSSSMPMVSSSSIFFSSSGSGTIVTNTLFWSNAVNDCFLDEGGGGAAADMPHNGTEMLLTCDQTSSDDSLRLCVLVDGFQGQLSNAYTIESAMLWLYCIGVSTDPPDSSETFEVYPLDMPWMEGEACWNKPDSSHSNWN
ncbi:MAG TPA: hypothetical protein VKS21_12400, partial [Spirochaetota bacterium]|nr:hypothetical protein [Spirochaetota bacterium]